MSWFAAIVYYKYVSRAIEINDNRQKNVKRGQPCYIPQSQSLDLNILQPRMKSIRPVKHDVTGIYACITMHADSAAKPQRTSTSLRRRLQH